MPFDACLLVTGAAASAWAGRSGLATDARGFIRVDRTLRSESHPHVFAAGDVAALPDPRPKSGVFAVRAGPALAASLRAVANGTAPAPWTPQRRTFADQYRRTARHRELGSLEHCRRVGLALEGLDQSALRARLFGGP